MYGVSKIQGEDCKEYLYVCVCFFISFSQDMILGAHAISFSIHHFPSHVAFFFGVIIDWTYLHVVLPAPDVQVSVRLELPPLSFPLVLAKVSFVG